MLMKKLVLLAFTSVLTFNLLGAEPTASDADQRWLAAIEKMVVNGRHEISTPAAARMQLLEDWAKKNGYSVQVTKMDATFHVELSKGLVKN